MRLPTPEENPLPEDDATDSNDSPNLELEKSSQHRYLARLIGSWEGISRTWFEPGQLADESPITGTIRPVLDGRFVAHEYESSLQGKRIVGMAIHGYAIQRKKFVTVWIDGFHMGTDIMLSEGGDEVKGDGFSVLGSYGDPAGESRWGWRTEVELQGEDALTITHYNIDPEGEEARAVEIQYKRKA